MYEFIHTYISMCVFVCVIGKSFVTQLNLHPSTLTLDTPLHFSLPILQLHNRNGGSTSAMISEQRSVRAHTTVRTKMKEEMPMIKTGRHTGGYPNILPPSHPHMAATP